MWQFVSLALLIAVASAEPQYNYPAPSIPFPVPAAPQCDPIQKVVYTTRVKDSVAVTTQLQVNTQYRTITKYQQQVVPVTRYNTQIQTRVQYETSYVQKQSQVYRDQVITKKQQGAPVYQTKYSTYVRVVPQVSYVVKEQVQTQVVPVELTNTRYQTQYKDQVQYQTSQIIRSSLVRIPGRDVYRTAYDTRYQTSYIQQPGPVRTRYATTTVVQQSVQVKSIPSPPVVRTTVAYQNQVIPTKVVNTRYQDQIVKRTQYVTRTQVQTQTKVQTKYVTQEVVVTKEIPREVVNTRYTTQIVPRSIVNTVISTRYNNPAPVISTRVSYYQSIVRVPGPDRAITKQIVNTQQRQEVVYITKNVQRPVTKTQYVTAPCQQQGGYNYQEPSIGFSY